MELHFGDFTGWLKRDGTRHIEGTARHHGMMCSDYEVGMRFGIGKPDCTDVQWISEMRYATSQSQYNDAEIDESLTGLFEDITCGERVIRCSGNCK
ncbi:MAG: hypothetical protein ABI479_03350 [Gallionella sp.]